MKRKTKILTFMLLFLCTFAIIGVPASAKNKKKYDLKVSQLKVNKNNLQAGNKCQVSMKIQNRGYKKIKNVYVCYRSSKQSYYLPLKNKKGKWVGSFKVEKGMQRGNWKIWSLMIDKDFSDSEGEWYSYYNHKVGNTSYKGADLSKADFRVKKTKADYAKPKMQWDTLNVTASDVNENGGKINCRVKISDKSSLFRVVLTVGGPITNDTVAPLETEIELKYNKVTGYYEGSEWLKKGNYMIVSVSAEDVFGNSAFHYNTEFGKYFSNIKNNKTNVDLFAFHIEL